MVATLAPMSTPSRPKIVQIRLSGEVHQRLRLQHVAHNIDIRLLGPILLEHALAQLEQKTPPPALMAAIRKAAEAAASDEE